MGEIIYSSFDENKIDLIKPLWEKLNAHHLKNSKYFKEAYKKFTFEARKKELLEKAIKGSMRMTFAQDKETGEHVGYIIYSITNGEGEIDSIFVLEEYRGRCIGESLMTDALSWLDENNAKLKRVLVANGNEDAFKFYEKYGFYPRATIMVRKNSV